MAKRAKSFTLMIRCDNDAFGDNVDEAEGEVARILTVVESQILNDVRSGGILDLNGNTVGSFELK